MTKAGRCPVKKVLSVVTQATLARPRSGPLRRFRRRVYFNRVRGFGLKQGFVWQLDFLSSNRSDYRMAVFGQLLASAGQKYIWPNRKSSQIFVDQFVNIAKKEYGQRVSGPNIFQAKS